MVKVNLGKCCTNCDHPKLRVQDFARGLRCRNDGGLDVLTDALVFCIMEARCNDYCSEVIEALPPEDILDG